jgi:hypothetical protein
MQRFCKGGNAYALDNPKGPQKNRGIAVVRDQKRMRPPGKEHRNRAGRLTGGAALPGNKE